MCNVHQDNNTGLNALTPSVKQSSGSEMQWGHFNVMVLDYLSPYMERSPKINTKMTDHFHHIIKRFCPDRIL